MAKNAPKKARSLLWEGIDAKKDFHDGEDNAENIDISDYNLPGMVIYSANVNYARQLVRLSDSLKPVERRILFTMYRHGLRPGIKKKSISVTGAVTEIHPHGGASIYETLIGMAQYWKKQVPLIKIFGSYGTEVSAIFAADRYTEATLSQYAWDCFFKDYDSDCVQMIFSTSGNCDEPVSLPSRYPNILINGGTGIAVGNAACIPPFNINDVIDATKKMLYHDDTSFLYLVPDFPTGCDIINDDDSIKRICETGRGTLRLRAKTEIIDEGKHWDIHCTNLPWRVTQESVVDSIVANTKNGQLPIKDVQDRHQQVINADGTVYSHVDLHILVDKAHDPYAVREKLFKKTKLEDTLPVNIKVVLEDLKLSEDNMPLSELIRQWIAERREYKRRLLNKTISKTTAQIELLKILIDLCSEENLETTVSIIKNSKDSEVSRNLMKRYGMSSYQADRIADMKLRNFTKEAYARYKVQLKEEKEKLKNLFGMVKSEKDIDDIIADELEELRKYAKPRKSQLVDIEGQHVDTETEYFILTTKRGGVKKVSVDAVTRGNRGFGKFESGDYPTQVLRARNLDSLLFVDSFGKFSVLKAGEIDTLTLADVPAKAYTFTKLEGEIISMQYFMGSETIKWLKESKAGEMYLVTISRDGYAKKISLADMIEMSDDGCKTIRNMRLTKLRNNDFLALADYYLSDSPLLIYTRNGDYNYIFTESIPTSSRDAIGNLLVHLKDGDYCVGCSAVDTKAPYLVVVTEKGCIKKCEMEFIGRPSPSKATSYLATLDKNDGVVYADTPKKSIDVCTKLNHVVVDLEEIRTLSRKAKPVKKVPLQTGDNIIRVVTQ